ncbi:S8 family serine peptidase [Nocardioides zeae]|uniref:S8 family serine peptidase n=1 Tax=Nocardioides imazamoxiresistens TaxID=3231893 RepID=A0ABU3PSB6_9ACTN|nr:S8 family serine peptidase [Nocardioides zeae]MDT9591786.1 S8 family serine peptidase [Nocardioides zeae]
MSLSPSRRWVGIAVAALGASLLSISPASSTPTEGGAATGAEPVEIPESAAPEGGRTVLSPSLDLDRQGRQTVFVQLSGQGAASAAAAASASRAQSTATQRRSQIESTAETVVGAAQRADSGATEAYTVTNAVPGVAVTANSVGIRALANQRGVVKVSPVRRHETNNSSAAALLRSNTVWQAAANAGAGVKIGVIDTGIDYTHATFGGEGTREAYEEAFAAGTEAGWREALPALGQAKIAGGYDFVGDDYNADPEAGEAYNPVPAPDPNPLDCEGHGTHVAGSAGGYGVTGDGDTFAGKYGSLDADALEEMQIGPGMAPRASLYGLRVFGCAGSTDQVIAALDWALDPNGDGRFDDRLDIVNMSLGSSFAPTDDPENAVIDELTRHGVLTVASNGNSGDLTDAGGSPGSATSALTVASSVDALQTRDAIEVTAPSSVAGQAAGQFSVAYDWAGEPPVSGTVATVPGNLDGCAPFTSEQAALVAGKVAWLEWDDNDATRACGSVARAQNAREAGAIGSLFTSDLDVFGAGISGDTEIPVVQLTGTETERLRAAAEEGTLEVTFDGDLAQSLPTYDDDITDTVSGFTSRGGHGTRSVVKPDVAAPGDTISSAAVGSGNGAASLSGTSMAAPVTAGVAALVLAQNPTFTPGEVKAAVMNTANNDLYTGADRSGEVYGPARVGAGRIDARSATTTRTQVWAQGANSPVSATFGVVNVPITEGQVTRSKTITVRNADARSQTYALGYEAATEQPGVSYTLSSRSLTVPARSSRTFTVTMVVDTDALGRTIDPTMELDQLGVPRQFVSAASGRITVQASGKLQHRVPVHGVARPNSTTSTSLANNQLVLDGAGVDQGESTSRQRSLVSVLELGERSGQLPVCTPTQVVGCVDQGSDRGNDLQAVGAGATDEWLWFGIDTWADWATQGRTAIPYVTYDVDGDGTPDVETSLQFLPDTDVLYSVTVDLSNGATLDLQPVNFFDADVDTNVFDTDVVLLPVSKEAVGLSTDGSSAPITYSVGVFDAYTGGDADSTGDITFDAGTPAISTAGPLFEDNDGATIDLSGAGGADALVLHLYGAPGRRGEIVSVPGVS